MKQAVVDREAEAESGREVQREDRDLGERDEDREDEEASPTTARIPTTSGSKRGDEAAEHEDQRDEHHRCRDELGPLEILLGLLADLAGDLGRPGDRRRDHVGVDS